MLPRLSNCHGATFDSAQVDCVPIFSTQFSPELYLLSLDLFFFSSDMILTRFRGCAILLVRRQLQCFSMSERNASQDKPDRRAGKVYVGRQSISKVRYLGTLKIRSRLSSQLLLVRWKREKKIRMQTSLDSRHGPMVWRPAGLTADVSLDSFADRFSSKTKKSRETTDVR